MGRMILVRLSWQFFRDGILIEIPVWKHLKPNPEIKKYWVGDPRS